MGPKNIKVSIDAKSTIVMASIYLKKNPSRSSAESSCIPRRDRQKLQSKVRICNRTRFCFKEQNMIFTVCFLILQIFFYTSSSCYTWAYLSTHRHQVWRHLSYAFQHDDIQLLILNLTHMVS